MTKFDVSHWGIECWESVHKFKVVRQLEHKDNSEPYEVDEAHVFELEDGRYATVLEYGCSCYSYDDAIVNIFDTLDEAMENFNNG